MRLFFTRIILSLAFLLAAPYAAALTDPEVRSFQKKIAHLPLGERIALWAERFVGVPYDTDPLGEYVTKKVIVADERVDCMYLSFRSVELALGGAPEEAVTVALEKRFRGKGVLKGGLVANYEDRFEYGEDMIDSGKWGREVTGLIGPVTSIQGTRGRDSVGMLSREEFLSGLGRPGLLQSGDFIFFIKKPDKRVAGEVVGHIGIVRMEGGLPFLIHAGGKKNIGGRVQKVPLGDYVRSMPFAGVRVSRFD